MNGQTVYAFGHELDGAGRRSLLLQDAYVYYVVNNPDPTVAPSYKLALPGHTLGLLSSDTPNAVIGEVGSAPPSMPVHVSAHDLDTGRSIALDTEVADETGVGLPLGASQVDAIAPLEVAQAATEIYNGPPADESGRMCLRIYLRESRAPLGFCNRYVGAGSPGDSGSSPSALASAAAADVASAFGELERVDFAALRIERVSADLDAARGLREATIVRARAPERVHAGRVVRVRLLVRLYRGGLRRLSFPLRIPAGARGPIVFAIHGPAALPPAAPGAPSLSSALTVALGGPATGPPLSSATPISSLAALRGAIAGIANYDGLYANLSGHGMRRVYRNRALLITGQTVLPLVVAG